MVQFFETYVSSQFVAAVRRQTQRIDNDENRIVAPVGTQFERKDIRNTVLVQLSWIVM